MTDTKLTSTILVRACEDIEALKGQISDYKIKFSQLYGQPNANVLNETLEQRAIEREAHEYADMLIRSADLPDKEE